MVQFAMLVVDKSISSLNIYLTVFCSTLGKDKRIWHLLGSKDPSFKRYIISGIIQFNPKSMYFRVVKLFGKDSGLLIDGENETSTRDGN
jgi:hypothetical protein